MGMDLSIGIVFGWWDNAEGDTALNLSMKRADDYINGNNDDLRDEVVDEMDPEDWELNIGWPYSETLEARRKAFDEFDLLTKATFGTTGVGDYAWSRYFGVVLAHGEDLMEFEPYDFLVEPALIEKLKADAANMEIEVDGEPSWFVVAKYW